MSRYLPYGVFSLGGAEPRVGVADGAQVVDLAAAADAARSPLLDLFTEPTLNRLMAGGPELWREVRSRVVEWADHAAAHRIPVAEVTLHRPVEVADFVDFYASEQHATNVGRIHRPGAEPLRPNWKHLPVAYHGRSGTVVVSGSPVYRPYGQRGPGDFGPTHRLDFEAEVGFVVGMPSRPGQAVTVDEFTDHVFGACLVNDWSARDIQAFESAPLGPFLSKSFATSMSPWIVPLAALDHLRTDPPPRDPAPPPYLDDTGQRWALEITLEVRLNGTLVTAPPFATMYWTAPQMLAQLTAGGAPLRTGDLFASGTVSGPDRRQFGSLIELTWNGERPLALPDGSTRGFLADGDQVSISAPGFGEVVGVVCAAAVRPAPDRAAGEAP